MMKSVAGMVLLAAGAICRAEPPLSMPELRVPLPPLAVRPVSIKLLPLPQLGTSNPRLQVPFGCGGVIDYDEPLPLGLIDLFGSVEDFRRVLSSETVELVELKPGAGETAAPESAERTVKLPAADAAALRSVLTSDASFDWGSTPPSEWHADLRVRFRQEARVVSLDVALAARSVRLVTDQNAAIPVSFEFGYPVAAEVIERYFPGILPNG